MNKKYSKIGKIPVVFVFEDEQKAKERGCILFFHGLGASKDVQMQDLENLASAGFFVAGIDNVGHGERLYSDFNERFSVDNPETEKNFLKAVQQTVNEIPEIFDHMVNHEKIHKDKIGVTGISMGAFITYGSVVKEKRLRAAVSILGSPEWKESKESPHLFLKAFAPTPILSLNAGRDVSVPAYHARKFHANLAAYYAKDPQKIGYIEYPNSEHFMLEDDWKDLWQQMIQHFLKWF